MWARSEADHPAAADGARVAEPRRERRALSGGWADDWRMAERREPMCGGRGLKSMLGYGNYPTAGCTSVVGIAIIRPVGWKREAASGMGELAADSLDLPTWRATTLASFFSARKGIGGSACST